MKKMYLMASAVMIFASSAMAQIGVGVEGGINLNNLADKYEDLSSNDETHSNQIKVGVHAGIVADIPVSANFSVAPGLRWSMKGGKIESTYNTQVNGVSAAVDYEAKRTYNYIELPINLVYKTGAPGGNRFMIGAGPYLAYMLNAQEKFKTETRVLGVEDEEAEVGSRQIGIGDDKDTDEVKALDYGAQAFLGYQTSMGIFAKVGSQFGFANTIPGGTSSFYSKNYNFFLTLGYKIK